MYAIRDTPQGIVDEYQLCLAHDGKAPWVDSTDAMVWPYFLKAAELGLVEDNAAGFNYTQHMIVWPKERPADFDTFLHSFVPSTTGGGDVYTGVDSRAPVVPAPAAPPPDAPVIVPPVPGSVLPLLPDVPAGPAPTPVPPAAPPPPLAPARPAPVEPKVPDAAPAQVQAVEAKPAATAMGDNPMIAFPVPTTATVKVWLLAHRSQVLWIGGIALVFVLVVILGRC